MDFSRKNQIPKDSRVPAFESITGFAPYPWQERCYESLLRGEVPPELTLPTGSGKTAVLLLYLIALAHGAPLPRRIAYIVDRRSIVDQTAGAIEQWIYRIQSEGDLCQRINALAAFPSDAGPVQLGTLRGGLADGGEWRMDPARPTIVVGTVDMIGSRLLFAGYGDGRNRRALHAGLLGVDTCVVLDECHLSPALKATLGALHSLNQPVAGFRFDVLSMSATADTASAATLDSADVEYAVLGARLTAQKRPIIHRVKTRADRLSAMADLLCGYDQGAILAFVTSAQEAQRLHGELVRRLGREREGDVDLLTGTLRGQERAALTDSPLWRDFESPPSGGIEPAKYLVATAAAEVGVDLDAAHSVMDLPPADSLIQRLGRVNRSGQQAVADVHIVWAEDELDTGKAATARSRLATARARTLDWLEGQDSLSPSQVMAWRLDERLEASTPPPKLVPLSAERVELLAATGVDFDKPPVGPYLRGIEDEPDAGDTQVCWRDDVDLLIAAGDAACREALAMMPPRPREILKAPTPIVTKAVLAMANSHEGLQAIRQSAHGQIEVMSLAGTSQRELERRLRYATLLLPASIGGLARAGYLDTKRIGQPADDLADDDEAVRFTLAEDGSASSPAWTSQAIQWRLPLTAEGEDDVSERWWVYAKRRSGDLALDADTDVARLARASQLLGDHNEAVGQAARALGEALGLPDWIVGALEDAGRWHDVGKSRKVWQRAAGNRGSQPVAKARRGVFHPQLLGGYRHEFGSLADAEREYPPATDDAERLRRELTLHLIAAHHGFARPGFGDPRQWDPNLPSATARALASATERRYAELQHHFGPWALAWLEALVKCADARVSSGLTSASSDA